MKVTCELIGKKSLEKLIAHLADAERNIDEAADKALLAAAEVIQAEMKRLAPVKTGNLRDHIKIKGPINDGHYSYVEVGIIDDLAFTDAETARYAVAQEYGKSNMAAHPFIRPGMENARKKARAAMRKSLKESALLGPNKAE